MAALALGPFKPTQLQLRRFAACSSCWRSRKRRPEKPERLEVLDTDTDMDTAATAVVILTVGPQRRRLPRLPQTLQRMQLPLHLRQRRPRRSAHRTPFTLARQR